MNEEGIETPKPQEPYYDDAVQSLRNENATLKMSLNCSNLREDQCRLKINRLGEKLTALEAQSNGWRLLETGVDKFQEGDEILLFSTRKWIPCPPINYETLILIDEWIVRRRMSPRANIRGILGS